MPAHIDKIKGFIKIIEKMLYQGKTSSKADVKAVFRFYKRVGKKRIKATKE